MTKQRRIGLLVLLLIAVICLSSVALFRPDLLDRLRHPARYATTGADLLDADRYAAAAQARARAGERVAQLGFPDGNRPVTVALAGSTAERVVYLDPPTARVLDIVAIASATGAQGMTRPVDVPRLTAAMAIDRARGLMPGEVLRVSWPTDRKPDWIVELQPDGGDAVTVAVADDGIVAVVLPPPGAQRSH